MTSRDVLDRPLLQLSDVDALSGRDLVGVLTFGASGSGKSSGVLFGTLLPALLNSGAGGLFLCPKHDDRQAFLDLARRAGREKDVAIIAADQNHAFDPLQYTFSTSRGDLEAVVDCFDALSSIGRNTTQQSGGERFFDDSTNSWVRAATNTLALARQPVSIANISAVLTSLPHRPGDFETDARWQTESYYAFLLGEIRKRQAELSPFDWSDLGASSDLFCVRVPAMDDRTRANVSATFSSFAERLLYHPFRRMIADGNCTITPEDAANGRLIVVDVPFTTFGRQGCSLAGAAVKYGFQRGFLRRSITPDSRLVFIAADEAHLFALPRQRDVEFAAVCRSARVVTLSVVQSVHSIAEAFGEQMPGARTRSWIANHDIKIALRNSCPTTNQHMTEIIGKKWATVRNVGVSAHSPQVGETEQQKNLVDPIEFTALRSPTSQSPIAEAIVHAGGRRFRATRSERHPEGVPFIRVNFSR